MVTSWRYSAGRNDLLSKQLNQSRLNAEAAKTELAEYKDKASRILQVEPPPSPLTARLSIVLLTVHLVPQSKDKLITSMRDNGGRVGEEADTDLATSISSELEQEKGMLRQELQQSLSTIDSLRMEIQVCVTALTTAASSPLVPSAWPMLIENCLPYQDLEVQLQSDHDNMSDRIDSLEDKLRQEQLKVKDLEQGETAVYWRCGVPAL